MREGERESSFLGTEEASLFEVVFSIKIFRSNYSHFNLEQSSSILKFKMLLIVSNNV